MQFVWFGNLGFVGWLLVAHAVHFGLFLIALVCVLMLARSGLVDYARVWLVLWLGNGGLLGFCLRVSVGYDCFIGCLLML